MEYTTKDTKQCNTYILCDNKGITYTPLKSLVPSKSTL